MTLIKPALLILTLAALSTQLMAQDTPPAPTTPEGAPAATAPEDPKPSSIFKNEAERRSYALGLNMAAQLKRAKEDPKATNLDDVMAGMKSILAGSQNEDFLKGISFGLFLKQSNLSVDDATLLMAIKDAMEGQPSKLSDSETRAELMSVQQGIENAAKAKQDAIASKNLNDATAFLEKNAKEPGVITTPSGLQYKVIKEAPDGGKVKEGDIVEVNLATYDTAGERLDKAMEGKTRKIGQNINKGFAEAMKLMTIGSKYKLWIPPTIGFGEQGRPGTKPNMLLIYEVELLAALEPPTKNTAAPVPTGVGATPQGMKKESVTATTPPVSVEIPADGGKPKVTPVTQEEMDKAKNSEKNK